MDLVPIEAHPVGVRGVVPAHWRQVDDGVYARGARPGDPALLHQRAVPHAQPAQIRALLAFALSLGRPPDPVDQVRAGDRVWERCAVEGGAQDRGPMSVRGRSAPCCCAPRPDRKC